MELYRKVMFGILALNAFIMLDSFLLPPVERNEVYYMRSDVVSPAGHDFRSSTTTEYLVTTNGHHYELPEHLYMRRTEGDSVTVGISRLLRQPYSVRWTAEDGQPMKVDIRPYTTGFFYFISLWVTTILCLLLWIFPNLWKRYDRDGLMIVCAFFNAMFFAFSLW